MGNNFTIDRRQFLKRLLYGGLGGVAFAFTTGGYSYFIEPFWFEIEKKTISLKRKLSQPLRILHFSDLHFEFPLDKQDFQSLTDQMNALRPDLICFTGDLADHPSSPITKIIPLLRQLTAPLGKFAVLGNHDAGHPDIETVFQAGGFQLLRNQNHVFQHAGQQIGIVGVEDWLTSSPDLTQALKGIPSDAIVLLLAHCPDYADWAKKYEIDLQLSGHSHGGQVKFPFIGAIKSVKGARNYVEGLYRWQDSQMQLYVSRGLGCAILPIRFRCRPQISLLELR